MKSLQPKYLMISGVVVLMIIGVVAAAGRAMFPGDLAVRVDPVRTKVLQALDREDASGPERAAIVEQLDRRFGDYQFVTMLHIVPGAIFLLLAPLQFSSRIRFTHIRFHRWCGRLLVVTGLIIALSGLFFGVVIPVAGTSEAVVIALVSTLFLAALGRAVVAIRRGQVEVHREWMIRAFAIALGISAIRIVATILDLTLSPIGYDLLKLFVLSLWLGWVITSALAEAWIRYTRPVSHQARRVITVK